MVINYTDPPPPQQNQFLVFAEKFPLFAIISIFRGILAVENSLPSNEKTNVEISTRRNVSTRLKKAAKTRIINCSAFVDCWITGC